MACSCYMVGTKVECTRLTVSRNLFREQTWGRAVRAPNNSRELGGASYLWRLFPSGEFVLPSASLNHLSQRHFRSLHERGARAHILHQSLYFTPFLPAL